jgi:hypothetical protein
MRAPRSIPEVALAVWAVGAILLGANLLAFHVVELPRPEPSTLAPALAALPEAPGRWRLTHFLYADCRCSSRIAEHLVSDPRRADVIERVVWIGRLDAAHDRLLARGYTVEALEPAELERRYGVSSAPLLTIESPEGALRYSGGYTSRKQGPVIEDLAILSHLEHGDEVASLPIFGCAISQSLKSRIDPIGLANLAANGEAP